MKKVEYILEKKCEITKGQVEYLGHMIFATRICPTEDKVCAVYQGTSHS